MCKIQIFVVSALVILASAQDCTPPKVPPRECCTGLNPSSHAPPACSECGLPPDASPVNPPPCEVGNCLMKKLNALTPDNKIVDKATYVSRMEPQYGADFKALVGPSYDACIGLESKAPCGTMAFLYCTKGYIFKNCPASAVVNNPDCAATKAFYEKCAPKKD